MNKQLWGSVLLVILVTIVLTFCVTTTYSSALFNETNVLIDLWNSTAGPQWSKTTNWLIGDPCIDLWYGVVCDDLHHVIRLYFFDNKLNGTIPDSIGNLLFLKELDLSTNSLTGTIPPSIGNLVSLTSLVLYTNQLTGTIFDTIGDLTLLTLLDLSENLLSGTIPPSIGDLTLLQELWLNRNNLNGIIPDSIGQLTRLTLLWMDQNDLSGTIPTSITQLTSLNRLVLYGNMLSGDISFVTSLMNLTNLDIEDNNLSGTIPNDIGLLTNLKKIWIGNNNFSGTLPVSLGSLPQLIYLSAHGNALNGTLPPELGQLTQLELLDLSRNLFEGDMPRELANLIKLTNLYLFDNLLHGGCYELNYTIDTCNVGDWQFKCLCPNSPTCPSASCSLSLDLDPVTHTLVLINNTYHVTTPVSLFKKAHITIDSTTLHFYSLKLNASSTLFLVDRYPSVIYAHDVNLQDSSIYNMNPSLNTIHSSACISVVNVTFTFTFVDTQSSQELVNNTASTHYIPFIYAPCINEWREVVGKVHSSKGKCYDVNFVKDVERGVVGVQMMHRKMCESGNVYGLNVDMNVLNMGVSVGVIGFIIIMIVVVCGVLRLRRRKNDLKSL
eukprot:TRINITY_DN1971_c0_g1_i1.p1 TRINITY_DN1971_c0_g1~~TRINITY_DN1971_c0_g1_i1.p1  ORF type:complete len:608 (+),score=94.72 TRINITY_DN1971_c0_g1_i1:53-1876(+)